jgi:GxxExxY protein
MQDTMRNVTRQVIGAAIAVHRELGPGLLESAYEACLAFEIAERGRAIERQKALPVKYRGREMGLGYRMDLVGDGLLIVELKVVERFEPIHIAQVLSYLRLSGCKLGLLLNFNVKQLAGGGVKRVINGYLE